MMKRNYWLALGLTSLLVACGGETKTGSTQSPPSGSFEQDQYDDANSGMEEAPPYDIDTQPQQTQTKARLDNSWWEGPDPCPPGTTLIGSPPPEHQRVGCKTEKGKNDGPSTEFFENGSKKEEGQFEDHFAMGVWTTWDGEGHRLSEISYVRGSKEGIETVWYSGGEIKSQRTYHGGRRDGITYIWDERARLRTALSYRRGLKHGPEAFFTIRGTLHELVHWENGKKKEPK